MARGGGAGKGRRLVLFAAVFSLAATIAAPFAALGVTLGEPAWFVVAGLDLVLLASVGIWAAHLVTRQRDLLNRLEEAERFQQLVLERVPEGVIVHENRAVHWANERAASILGYGSGAELVGLPLKRFYSEDTNRLIEDRYPAFRESGEWREVFPMLRKDGTPIRCRQAVALIEETGGEYPRVLLSFRDITEEEDVVAGIERTSRMAALERMAGGAAHDFNNVLGGIMGYASLMEERSSGDETMRRYSSTVMSTARQGSNLTDQLLVFARGSKSTRSLVEPNAIVCEARDRISGRIKPEMVFKHSCREQTPLIRCSKDEIVNALESMCINAIEAMPEGGVLSLDCDVIHVSHSEPGDYRGLAPGLYVRFTVSDTGEGISEEHMEHIFEPFFSTKERRIGTGMGLPMAYAVVREHGGDIRVDSEVGRGSEFQTLLPAAEKTTSDEGPPEQKETRAAEANLVGLKVMVVEDDRVVLNFLEECLVGEGAVVAAAPTEAEALKIISEGFIPQVALVDVVLPDGEGLALGSRLKDRGVTVVGMSGRGAAKNRSGQEAEVDGFLRKPFDKAALLGLIRSVVSSHGGQEERPPQ